MDLNFDAEMKKRFVYTGGTWLDDDGNICDYAYAARATLSDIYRDLKPMTGSPKQRAWAEDIRLKFLGSNPHPAAKQAALIAGKKTSDCSSDWIRNRNNLETWLRTRMPH